MVTLRGHPKTGDRFRSILAQWSLWQLLAAFLAILLVLGALLGLGYHFTEDGDKHSYLFWARESILLLSGLATVTTQEDEQGWHAAFQAVGAVGGLVVPALVLGTVVFKAFVKDRVFVTRGKLALMGPDDVRITPDKPPDHWLAIRIYSRTKLQLVNLSFAAYARVEGTSLTTGARIVTNIRLKLYKDHWPVALTHVPYTLYSPLWNSNLQWTGSEVRLVSIRDESGEKEHELKKGCDILLTVTGSIPELGTDLVESHWFGADKDLSPNPFGEIDAVDYPPDRRTWKRSRKWKNWKDFDESV